MDDKVLIVDGNPQILAQVNADLTNAGYQTVSSSNGRDALRIIMNEGLHVLITGVDVPEMTGVEVCRAIHSLEGVGFVFTVVMVERDQREIMLEAFEAGADDVLIMPYHDLELVARVKAGFRTMRIEEDLAARNRQLHKVNAEMALLNDQLKDKATTDELTGLSNRRDAMDRLGQAWATARRHRQPLSCLMLDIDHFKKVNDTYGHDTGDRILREVADLIRVACRVGDTVCRVVGEEFLVICPFIVAAQASVLAERIRSRIAEYRFDADHEPLSVTISIGASNAVEAMSEYEEMLKAADVALYAAKQKGRNRVCIAGSDQAAEEPELRPEFT